ncbi:MAG: glycosyltransferase [Candidatus Eisenbacteria sp.]|nr:glycosyltransferase [Candidatus Eisenbacteria bacterium]
MGQGSESPIVAPIRILVPLASAALGGSQLALMRLIAALPPGAATFSCWLFGGGPMISELDRRGIPWRVLPSHAMWTPWGLLGLLRVLRHERPDLLYLHAGRIFSILARLAGVPCLERINVPRAPGAGGWSRWRWIDRLCTRLATRALVVSHALRRQLIARGVPPEKVIVLRDPVDPEALRRPELRARVRRRLALSPETPMILNVGRLVSAKAQRDLLRIAAASREQRPDARFLIVGSGPLEDLLNREIARLNLTDRVALLPFDEQIAGYYAAADLYLQTSHWEGLPGVVLEARAAGLPVVATDVGGTAEALVGHEASRLIEAGNVAALADAVADALADCGAGARPLPVVPFPTEFTPLEVGRRFMEVVAGVLPSDPRAVLRPPPPAAPEVGEGAGS